MIVAARAGSIEMHAVGLRVAGRDGQRHAAVGPEHAEGGLVADHHHVGRGPAADERGDRVGGIATDALDQPGKRQVGPGGGFRLLLRIGPVVRIVQRQREMEAGGLDATAERQRLLQVAPRTAGLALAIAVGGVDEGAQLDRIEPGVGEDRERIALPAILPIGRADRLVLGDPRDIGADQIRPRPRRPGSEGGARHRCKRGGAGDAAEAATGEKRVAHRSWSGRLGAATICTGTPPFTLRSVTSLTCSSALPAAPSDVTASAIVLAP